MVRHRVGCRSAAGRARGAGVLRSAPWGAPQKTLGTFYEMAFSGIFHTEEVHPKIVEFDAAIEPHIQEAYNGTISPQDALNRAERDGNAALAG